MAGANAGAAVLSQPGGAGPILVDVWVEPIRALVRLRFAGGGAHHWLFGVGLCIAAQGDCAHGGAK